MIDCVERNDVINLIDNICADNDYHKSYRERLIEGLMNLPAVYTDDESVYSVAVGKGHKVNYTAKPKEKLIDRDIIIAELQRCIQMELDMELDNERNFMEKGTDCELFEERLRGFANGVVQGLNVAIGRIRFISTDVIENDESVYTDEVGGHHDSGIGWNPNGVWCGECSRATCNGCVNQNVTKAVWEE